MYDKVLNCCDPSGPNDAGEAIQENVHAGQGHVKRDEGQGRGIAVDGTHLCFEIRF